jgi:hypothetical protein
MAKSSKGGTYSPGNSAGAGTSTGKATDNGNWGTPSDNKAGSKSGGMKEMSEKGQGNK